MSSVLDEILNTNNYPLSKPNTAIYRQLVQRLHDEYMKNGLAILPQFMKKDAIGKTLQMIEQSRCVPYGREVRHNIYNEDFENEINPGNIYVQSRMKSYAYDQVDPLSPLNKLFMCDEMTEFVRRVLGKDELYRRNDTLGALNVFKFLQGDELGWHFDRSPFAVTLLLQEPEHGGEFQYYPSIRNEDNPNYNKIKEIVTLSEDGQTSLEEHGVRTANLKPGTLCIFCGLHSLHRVKPIQGDIPRYVAVLSYEQEPDVPLNDYVKRKFFGRLN